MVKRRLGALAIGSAGVAVMTLALRLTGVSNATTISLSYLLVVLFVASLGDTVSAGVTSVAAMLCFNYFFLPPVGNFTIADPHNWIALIAFLVVSVVASRLSAAARAKAQEALDRRNELTRLFDLSRDILLTTESDGALAAIARHVARRFELDMVAICVPAPAGGWSIDQGGAAAPDLAAADLDRAFAAAAGAIEFDARTRSYGGHREVASPTGPIILTPVRIGAKTIGLLATGGRPLEARHSRRRRGDRRDRTRALGVSRGAARRRAVAPAGRALLGAAGLAQPRSTHAR